jgi:Domain of unknown function (DUF3850)
MVVDSSAATSRQGTPTPSDRLAGARNSVEHKVKSWPQFFELMLSGEKTHELRRSDDRDFRVGDLLRLQELDPTTNRYTGRELASLRALAKKAKDGNRTRRLVAIAEIYDGGSRSDAARIGGVGLQTIRDCDLMREGRMGWSTARRQASARQ